MTTSGALLEVQTLSMADLRAKYEEVLGEPTTSRDRSFLLGQVIPALRDRAVDEAPVSAVVVSTRKREEKAKSGAGRDERLPPVGSVLTREFNGKTYSVTVLEEGFEFKGGTWPSLTRIAREITGTPWNGFLFFRLSKYPKRMMTVEDKSWNSCNELRASGRTTPLPRFPRVVPTPPA